MWRRRGADKTRTRRGQDAGEEFLCGRSEVRLGGGVLRAAPPMRGQAEPFQAPPLKGWDDTGWLEAALTQTALTQTALTQTALTQTAVTSPRRQSRHPDGSRVTQTAVASPRRQSPTRHSPACGRDNLKLGLYLRAAPPPPGGAQETTAELVTIRVGTIRWSRYTGAGHGTGGPCRPAILPPCRLFQRCSAGSRAGAEASLCRG
jgi:hypothetical protein